MMQEYLAENARLRQLSKRYAAAEIGLDEYRAARRAIIEALEAGEREQGSPLQELEQAGQSAPSAALTDPGLHLGPGNPADGTVFTRALASSPSPVDEPQTLPDFEMAPPEPAADSGPMDSHTLALLVILVVALVIALSALVYVFIL